MGRFLPAFVRRTLDPAKTADAIVLRLRDRVVVNDRDGRTLAVSYSGDVGEAVTAAAEKLGPNAHLHFTAGTYTVKSPIVLPEGYMVSGPAMLTSDEAEAIIEAQAPFTLLNMRIRGDCPTAVAVVGSADRPSFVHIESSEILAGGVALRAVESQLIVSSSGIGGSLIGIDVYEPVLVAIDDSIVVGGLNAISLNDAVLDAKLSGIFESRPMTSLADTAIDLRGLSLYTTVEGVVLARYTAFRGSIIMVTSIKGMVANATGGPPIVLETKVLNLMAKISSTARESVDVESPDGGPVIVNAAMDGPEPTIYSAVGSVATSSYSTQLNRGLGSIVLTIAPCGSLPSSGVNGQLLACRESDGTIKLKIWNGSSWVDV